VLFNTRFNLHFHKIGKDTCLKCDGYKAKMDALEDRQPKEALITHRNSIIEKQKQQGT
jgi:hypothetical protein